MNTVQAIQVYFKDMGIEITQPQAADVIALVLNLKFAPVTGPTAKLYRFLRAVDANTGTWQHVYTIQVTQEQINAAVQLTTQIKPVMDCFMWECFNQAGEFEGKIFTDNIKIF